MQVRQNIIICMHRLTRAASELLRNQTTPSASAPSTAPPSPTSTKRSIKTGMFSMKKAPKKGVNAVVTPPAEAATSFGFPPDAGADPSPEAGPKRECIVNVRRRIAWYEQDIERSNDVLPQANIRSFPTTHDINRATADLNTLEVVIHWT